MQQVTTANHDRGFVTLIKSVSPAQVNKTFSQVDGAIVKKATANIWEGVAYTREAGSAEQLAEILGMLTKRNDVALAPGIWHNSQGRDSFRIVKESDLAAMFGANVGDDSLAGVLELDDGSGIAARLKRGIDPSCWVLIDADNPPGIPEAWAAMTIGERLKMLERVVKGISTCERIELRASSARVIKEGEKSRPATHAWIRISDPNKLQALRAHLGVATVNAGLSFVFEKHSRNDPSVTVGREHRTLIDLAVLDAGRLAFLAEPALGDGMEGYVVDDAGVTIVNAGAGALDVSGINIPSKTAVAKFKELTGFTVSISDTSGVVSTRNTGQLTLATEIEAKGVIKSLEAWAADMEPGDKMRCESPFRVSQSEAAFIKIGEDGSPFMYDVGCNTTYLLARDRNVDIAKLFEDVILTSEDTEKMANAEFIVDNLIVRGHVHYFAAPGNGGKTTIMVHLCPEIVSKGYQVFYINVDGNSDDLKRHEAHAQQYGYKVICPDGKSSGGKSIEDVMTKLQMMAEADIDLSHTVFFFDTLKKFLDVINKGETKRFNNLMRVLSQKGLTVVLLGHTNKHKDGDGKLVYEGTGDMRNDVDDLIYLNSSLNEYENVLDVTTKPDKVRAKIEPRSFRIHLNENRRVEEVGYIVNIIDKEERLAMRVFKDAIIAGNHTQGDIVRFAAEVIQPAMGEKKLTGLLQKIAKRSDSPFRCRKTGVGKTLHYHLTEAAMADITADL